MNNMEVMTKVPRKKKTTVIKRCPCKKMIIVKVKELLETMMVKDKTKAKLMSKTTKMEMTLRMKSIRIITTHKTDRVSKTQIQPTMMDILMRMAINRLQRIKINIKKQTNKTPINQVPQSITIFQKTHPPIFKGTQIPLKKMMIQIMILHLLAMTSLPRIHQMDKLYPITPQALKLITLR